MASVRPDSHPAFAQRHRAHQRYWIRWLQWPIRSSIRFHRRQPEMLCNPNNHRWVLIFTILFGRQWISYRMTEWWDFRSLQSVALRHVFPAFTWTFDFQSLRLSQTFISQSLQMPMIISTLNNNRCKYHIINSIVTIRCNPLKRDERERKRQPSPRVINSDLAYFIFYDFLSLRSSNLVAINAMIREYGI